MSEITANLWLLEAPPRRWRLLVIGLVMGILVGSMLTALAGPPTRALFAPEPAVVTSAWRGPALDREWRGLATPVDVDRMFRKTR